MVVFDVSVQCVTTSRNNQGLRCKHDAYALRRFHHWQAANAHVELLIVLDIFCCYCLVQCFLYYVEENDLGQPQVLYVLSNQILMQHCLTRKLSNFVENLLFHNHLLLYQTSFESHLTAR